MSDEYDLRLRRGVWPAGGIYSALRFRGCITGLLCESGLVAKLLRAEPMGLFHDRDGPVRSYR
jgi:hypothetical protein